MSLPLYQIFENLYIQKRCDEDTLLHRTTKTIQLLLYERRLRH